MKKPQDEKPLVSYAQNFEDVMLWRAFSGIKEGCYIDIGANDPIVDSVSKLFYDNGWRGVHVEPIPLLAEKLSKARPDEVVIEAALGEVNQTAQVAVLGGLSTLEQTYLDSYVNGGENLKLIPVAVRSTREALAFLEGKTVHWMKIDVEGFESAVLKGWDSNVLRPWIILVESTKPCSSEPNFDQWEHILIAARYEFIYFDGLNRFYVAHEHNYLKPAFASPPNVFDRFALSGLASHLWCEINSGDLLREDPSKGSNNKAALREKNVDSNGLKQTACSFLFACAPSTWPRYLIGPFALIIDRIFRRSVAGKHGWYATAVEPALSDHSPPLTLPDILKYPRRGMFAMARQPRKICVFAFTHPLKFLGIRKREFVKSDILAESAIHSNAKKQVHNLIRSNLRSACQPYLEPHENSFLRRLSARGSGEVRDDWAFWCELFPTCDPTDSQAIIRQANYESAKIRRLARAVAQTRKKARTIKAGGLLDE